MNDFAGSTDAIAEKLVAGGMDPQQAMMMALRLKQEPSGSLALRPAENMSVIGKSMNPPGLPESVVSDTVGIIKNMDDASVIATASRMTGLPFDSPIQARLMLEKMLGGGASISAGLSGIGSGLPQRLTGYEVGARFPALGGQVGVGAAIPRGQGSPAINLNYQRQFQEGGSVLASDTDKIAEQLIAGGVDPQQAMTLALRMAQSRQQADQSILGGVPTQPPVSDVPPATEILGGDPSKLFQRQPTTMERIKDLPKDVLGAADAMASMGSLVGLAVPSMMYALRPGQKTQGDPMEFALRNMYMPRSERGPSHLAGLGEVLESLPQTGPLPELQAFTGVGRGVGRQLAEKGRQAGRAMAPAAANVAEDILSRQGLLMQAAPSGPTRVEAPASSLGFYDPVHQAALNIQRKQGPGQAFLNEIQRSENVNKEFLEASGLAEKLRTTPNITREEVQSLAKGAVPEIKEVVRGENAPVRKMEDELYRMAEAQERAGNSSLFTDEILAGGSSDSIVRMADVHGGPEEMVSLARRINDIFRGGVKPKYASYQLPGGENYREVLLTIPEKGTKVAPSFEEWHAKTHIRPLEEVRNNPRLMEIAIRQYERDKKAFERNPNTFRSSHWDEPNVVSHIRMNDRTDADGKKVLFIEEIQSDWAQEGRKKGFSDPKIKPVSSKQYDAFVDSLFDEYINRAVSRGEDRQAAGRAALHMRFEDLAKTLDKESEYQRMRAGRDLDMSGEKLVPVAPFVQNTKEWVDLSLKNIIKRAVDEGYDRVAFVNGTQSADRYDLSKQINMVTAYKQTGGGFKISATDKNGNTLPVQKVKDEAELEGIVGRDLAAKIAAQNRVVEQYSGLDLKVGGEGMKAFYDKLVPERVNAILKRFGGGKATTVSIGGQVKPPNVFEFARYDQYEQAVKEQKDKKAPTMQQIGFDITPAMRERFQKPIPYKQGGSVNHKAVASARRALEKAMAKGGEVKMGTGGSMLGTVAGRAAAGKKSTQWAQEAAAAKRAPAKSKEEIEAIARRMAAQTQPGFVRASEEQSINPAGKSQLLYEMEQRTPMVVESTIADRPVPNVDYEQQLGKVIVGVPGDPTMGQVAVPGSLDAPTRGGKQLVQVGDVRPETPVQLYGGPRYGANLDETFWASNLSPARAVQNLVQEMAQKYGAEQVLGKYIKMSPESSRFAMHNLDALISVLQPEKLDKDKVELLNNLVRKGSPKHKFPEFAGFEDPINVLLQAQMNSKLRKQISEVLEKPSVAKQVGFPFPGKVVQTAITEPELRNVETGVTGFAMGKMNPEGKLSFSSHPTYDYDIPGKAIGRSKYLVPSEMSFPDFTAWYRSRPDVQAKVDPINMMKSYGPRQVIDQQYIDEIKMYEEAMKRLTGKKKGGQVTMAGGGLTKVIKSAAKRAGKPNKSFESNLISPKKIDPPHRVENQNKLDSLVKSMESEGWVGRPILYYDIGRGPEALTGSHRIAAAIKAGLEEVPAVKVEGDIGSYVDNLGRSISELYDLNAADLSKWLKKYGDETAARLIKLEETDKKKGGLAALRK